MVGLPVGMTNWIAFRQQAEVGCHQPLSHGFLARWPKAWFTFRQQDACGLALDDADGQPVHVGDFKHPLVYLQN